MHVLLAAVGVFIILATLRDAFLAILLPRTVQGSQRLTGKFTRVTWRFYSRLVPRRSRFEDGWLALYGPLSIVLLIAVWAALLIFGFALLLVGLEIQLNGGIPSLGESIYVSGVTFLTLGFGDLVAHDALGRALSVLEAGLGFAFLAIVVSYLPVLYNSFSRREGLITLMDARAGSPPSGGEMLRRFGKEDDWDGLMRWLERWETWSAELLETHLSYPTLAFYRSQHSDTSWLCALTAVLDACAILLEELRGVPECSLARRQAQLTYAMARHAVVDLTQVFNIPPGECEIDRLPSDKYQELVEVLKDGGLELDPGDGAEGRLREMRDQYEPYVVALSRAFRLNLPAWIKDPKELDNWQTSAWDHRHL